MSSESRRRWLSPTLLFCILFAPLPARAAVDVDARIAAAKSLDRTGYEPGFVAGRAAPETEPNDGPDTATPIELDAAVDASVPAVTDQDWFALTTAAGSFVTLSTSSTGAPGADTVMELFASDGVTLLALDDDSGMGLFSALEHVEVPGDGVLLVRVTRYSALGGDDYRLLAEAGTAPPPAPANDLVGAAELLDDCNDAVTGSTVGASSNVAELTCLDVDPVGGEVYYRVTVPFSFELTVLIEPTSAWDVSAYMFTNPVNPAGTCIDASDFAYAGEAEELRFLNERLPEQDREVFIAVDSWSAASAGGFILSTRCDFVVPNEGSSFGMLKSRFQGN